MKKLQLSKEEFSTFQANATFMYQHSVSGEYVNILAQEGDLLSLGYKPIELEDVD